MLEQEIEVKKNLKIILHEYCDRDENYNEVVSLVDQDKHPILHRYVSMKARILNQRDG